MVMACFTNFNCDFSSYLDGKDVKHTVKIVTDTEVQECSALLLAQNSTVLRDLVEKEDEIFLNNYGEGLKDCLKILYGGKVELCKENYMDILKFSAQFALIDIFDQVTVFMRENVVKENLVEYLEASATASSVASSHSTGDEYDSSWVCNKCISSMTDPVEITELLKSFLAS